VLRGHFAASSKRKASPPIAEEALAMIARAADGSVRDGLSLLDQAIALGGGTTVTAEQVQAMLGLADRARIFDLLEALMAGEVAGGPGSSSPTSMPPAPIRRWCCRTCWSWRTC
jgi:DNA polymerase III subunit gamma/tau